MKIGDRVISRVSGNLSRNGWKGSSVHMKVGIKGIITKKHGDSVQILADDGSYYVRVENFLDVLEQFYEIY